MTWLTTEEPRMTSVMAPAWKAAMPKISSTAWVHSDFAVDAARLLKTSLLLLLESMEKAKEKWMRTPLALVDVVFSCNDKTSPALKPSSQELGAAHCWGFRSFFKSSFKIGRILLQNWNCHNIFVKRRAVSSNWAFLCCLNSKCLLLQI